jgi:hypothetical protein
VVDEQVLDVDSGDGYVLTATVLHT